MIRRPPRSTQGVSSAASDVYKRQELVFEVPESEVAWLKTEVPRIMAGVADLKVPLLAEVGVGANWDQAH